MDSTRRSVWRPLLLALLPALLLVSCKHAQKGDTDEQDQAALWLSSVPDLQPLQPSNAELAELSKAHQSGLSDAGSVTLIRLARSRHKPFADGQPVADLLGAGVSESTVLQLARMNQFGVWAGEAEAMRLAGLSDQVILAVAQRRSQNLPVLSGETLGDLKNAGTSDAEILEFVQKGVSEQDADRFIAQRERAAGGHGFVYQHHRRG